MCQRWSKGQLHTKGEQACLNTTVDNSVQQLQGPQKLYLKKYQVFHLMQFAMCRKSTSEGPVNSTVCQKENINVFIDFTVTSKDKGTWKSVIHLMIKINNPHCYLYKIFNFFKLCLSTSVWIACAQNQIFFLLLAFTYLMIRKWKYTFHISWVSASKWQTWKKKKKSFNTIISLFFLSLAIYQIYDNEINTWNYTSFCLVPTTEALCRLQVYLH